MQYQTLGAILSWKSTILLSVALAVLVSCGPSKTDKENPGPAIRAKARGVLPVGRWAELTPAQKALHMNDVVMPRMTALFQAQDAEKYAKVECGLCHRTGAVTGNFSMPDPGLPEFESYAAIERDTPRVIAFMERVEKEMAHALGVPVYDPVTHKGLKCTTCHVVGKKASVAETEVEASLFTETMTVVTADRQQAHFQIEMRIALRSKTPGDMRGFTGNWYANNVQDQVMAVVRNQATVLTTAEVIASLKEIESEVLRELAERYANTPVRFESFELSLDSTNESVTE